MILVGDVKKFLLANPNQTLDLKKSFEQHHIRIPVINYSNAVKESSYLHRFQDWMRKYKWAKNAVRTISIEYLIESAKKCEIQYKSKINDLIEKGYPETTYKEKRLTPKLRYLAGRLLYLLDVNELEALSSQLLYPVFPNLLNSKN